MTTLQDSRTPPRILTEKVSAAFSTRSAASATTASTPRSGGSRLLFGEIDTSSERSDSFASVCSLVLADNSFFTRFWLNDVCREALISHLTIPDLTNLRLVCHDFAVRTAPALFANFDITFRANTFSKPSRLAALHRLGFHTKSLTFTIPHSQDFFLPPLVEPESGEELSLTYTPRIQPPALREPKYGDAETTEILTRQYPPSFHAATNVHSFVNAFSAFVNLSHLKISCPGYNNSWRYRRSTVDFALISLRIAIERNCLNSLNALTLAPIHPAALHYLSPLSGYGSTPASFRKWARIRHLTVHLDALPSDQGDTCHQDQVKLLQAYLSIFKRNLKTFIFRWNHTRGPLPFTASTTKSAKCSITNHPAYAGAQPSNSSEETIRPQAPQKVKRQTNHTHYPLLRHLEVENALATAAEINNIVTAHKHTLEDLDFRDITLTSGTWEQAFAPLTSMAAKSQTIPAEEAHIPIMLSPTVGQPFPRPMNKVEPAQGSNPQQRRSMRASRWLGAKRSTHLTPRTPLLPSASAGAATKIVKQGLLDCEAQVKKVFKGKVFAWI